MKSVGIVLVFLCLTTEVANAGPDDEKKGVEKAIKLQQKFNSAFDSPENCPQVPNEEYVSQGALYKLIQECEKELCGKLTPKNNTVMHNYAGKKTNRRREGLFRQFDQEMKPRLLQVLKNMDDELKSKAKAIEGALAQTSAVPDWYPAENYAYLSRGMSKMALSTTGDPLRPLAMDLVKTKENLVGWSKADKKFFLALAQDYFNSDEYQKFLIYLYNHEDPFLKHRYPDLTLQEARKQEYQKLNELLTKARSSPYFNQTSISQDASRILGKAIAGEGLTESEQSEILKCRFALLSNGPLYLSDSKFASFRSKPLHTDFYVGATRSTLELALRRLNNTNALEEEKPRVIDLCRSGFFYGKEEAPTAKMKASWGEVDRKAKDQVKEKIIPKFSQQTQALLLSTLDQTQSDLSLSKEEVQAKFEGLLKTHESKPPTVDYAKMPYSKLATVSTELLGGYFSILNVCSEFRKKGVSDLAKLQENETSVSAWSIKRPNFGKSILLHEYGHILSWVFQSQKVSPHSKNSYDDIRKCLDQKHANEADFDSGQFVEEDWADLVSVAAGEPEDLNSHCLSMKSVMFDSSKLDGLANTKSGAVHSNELFRALHFHQIRKETLPSACTKMIQAFGTPYDFSSCM